MWADLPLEVKLKIFESLLADEGQGYTAVCREWRDLQWQERSHLDLSLRATLYGMNNKMKPRFATHLFIFIFSAWGRRVERGGKSAARAGPLSAPCHAHPLPLSGQRRRPVGLRPIRTHPARAHPFFLV